VMLVVDVSRSMRFGTTGVEKRELAAELTAVLGFSAIQNNDRVGLVLAAEHVEHFVPPGRGRTHLMRMLRDVLGFTPPPGTTRLGEAVRFVLQTTRRRSLVFWISDFEDSIEERDWRVLGRRHELTAIVLRDPRDEVLPAIGWADLEDLETGRRALVNTSLRGVRESYSREARERRRRVDEVLSRSHCPVLEVRTDRSYLPTLIGFFSSKNRAALRG